jgi:hypothetical protein
MHNELIGARGKTDMLVRDNGFLLGRMKIKIPQQEYKSVTVKIYTK